MASSSDVRDILQLPAPGEDAGPSTTSSIRAAVNAEKSKEKKGDALTRELLSLTGGAPPVVIAKKKYKARPNFSKQITVSPWVWKPFKNPARKDDLELHHWVKASDEADYYFATFNKQVEVVQYDDAEYDAHVKNLLMTASTPWTRAETDHLYGLCKTFDLRWHVIADRFEWPGHTRTIDDLRERYFGIAHALLAARGTAAVDLTPYNFNKPRELERKKNLEILYSRTAEQIREEEHLFYELRRREQKEDKLLRERETVWQLLRDNELKGSVVKEMIGTSLAGGLPTSDKALDKLKKRRSLTVTGRRNTSVDADDAATPTSILPGDAGTARRRKVKDEDSPEHEEPSALMKRMGPGVFARSQKLLPAPKASLLPRIQDMMRELSVEHNIKPHMPTANVCEMFVQLQTNCQTLLELKKVGDKVDFELNKLRIRARDVAGNAAVDGGSSVPRKRASVGTPSSSTPAGNVKRQRNG
ncbi:uncharacterized protein EV422DRAFT_570701 [Fimicolochytrium jonesii]|uniref:uncharacterized protein n=1 Tax=Fimicolochytrium jonesii TaxID=1396493 RepID=UPI0022FEFEAF|nr:uncharacterized protein EV422DRAFT_570701 [Fimicolochytrium jonesii]KAI8817357.1 hypothetical protein EV422DRAFT_570701 [Fimicolochytrium jonesii]